MEKQEHDMKSLLRIGTPQSGLLLATVGALVGLSLVTHGFWATLLIAACALVGYYLGANRDKAETSKRFINKLFPPKGE